MCVFKYSAYIIYLRIMCNAYSISKYLYLFTTTSWTTSFNKEDTHNSQHGFYNLFMSFK